MRSPALAIAWSIWSRHRTGFIISLATLAVVAIGFPILATVTAAGTIAIGSAVLLAGVFVHVLNAMLFAEDEGSLSSRFPRHMLTLPVPTRTLAFWPMVLTSSCAGLLWVTVALLIYRPGGYPIPVLLPALGLAAVTAWAQALAWFPMNIIWFREVLNLALIAGLSVLPVWLTVTGRGSGGLMAALLLAYLATAGLLGWAAVASDRRGQTWPLGWGRSPFDWVAFPRALARRRRPFRSPFESQVWFEWNCHGLMLNGFVGAGLFMVWGVLLSAGRHGESTWFATIIVLLAIVLVGFIAASGTAFGRFRPFWSRTREFETFMAVRPMSSGGLVAAKVRMSAASVLWSWGLGVAGTAFWIVVSGNIDNATIVARDFFQRYPGGSGIAIIALACIVLPTLSWRLLTGPLTMVLAGRRWVAETALGAYMSLVVGLAWYGYWVSRSPERLVGFYAIVPWLIAGVAIAKGAVAAVAFRATLRLGLMTWRNVVSVLTLWLCLSGCWVAMAILVGPLSFVPVSGPTFVLGVATFVPLVRFPLATLALDWNRHR